jgi:ribonuclease D
MSSGSKDKKDKEKDNDKEKFDKRLRAFQENEAKKREKKLDDLLKDIFDKALPEFLAGLTDLRTALQDQKSYETALKAIIKELDPIPKDDIVTKIKKMGD